MPTEAINPMVVIPLSAQPPPDPHENSDTESLTDAQVSSLLAAAENRLQQKESARTNSSSADAASIKASKLDAGKVVEPYIRNQGGVAKIDGRRGVGREEREAAERVRVVEKVEKGKGGKEANNAGPQWYNLPATDPELKKDLKLLNLRSVLDPKRHYKKESSKPSLPQYAQQGTIIEGPTEYYSARIPKKQRHQTLVEEVLAGEYQTGKFKKGYNDIQDKKTSGRKAHYKMLKQKRRSQK